MARDALSGNQDPDGFFALLSEPHADRLKDKRGSAVQTALL
jgi:hypothetical protein